MNSNIMSQLNVVSFRTTPNEQHTEIKHQKEAYSLRNNKLVYMTLGCIAASTIWMLNRTSNKKLSEIANRELKYLQVKNRKNAFKEFYFESLKNNNNVKTLDELSGLDEIKLLIDNHLILAENKDVMNEHNIKPQFSILFWGVPGTGKTSAAMGIAKKLDADFIRLDKELFDSEFISRGPRQLAEYFRNIKDEANKNPKKNILVFMDEIDSTIGIDRGLEAKQDESLVNVLKQGITDLQECDNIIFIGATNKDPNGIKSDNNTLRLNPAILSRFKYQMEIGLPNKEAICDAWTKLMKTGSGKDKFTLEQNEMIAKCFQELKMSFRDVTNIADKLNRADAVEFCQKKSYNSKENLLKVLANDEKIGYDPVKKQNIDKNTLTDIIKHLQIFLET